MILEKGSDPSIKGGKFNWSPFFLACMIAPQLDKRRLRLDDQSQEYKPISCTFGEQDNFVKEICEKMLKQYESIKNSSANDINDKSDKEEFVAHQLVREEDSFGYTPLFASILQSNIELVK